MQFFIYPSSVSYSVPSLLSYHSFFFVVLHLWPCSLSFSAIIHSAFFVQHDGLKVFVCFLKIISTCLDVMVAPAFVSPQAFLLFVCGKEMFIDCFGSQAHFYFATLFLIHTKNMFSCGESRSPFCLQKVATMMTTRWLAGFISPDLDEIAMRSTCSR